MGNAKASTESNSYHEIENDDYIVGKKMVINEALCYNNSWFISFLQSTMSEILHFKIFQDVFSTLSRDKAFYILVLWTFLCACLAWFVHLPSDYLKAIILIVQSQLTMFVYPFCLFGIWIWFGLFVKHSRRIFYVRICFAFCFFLELTIEICSFLNIEFTKELFYGGITVFVLMVTGGKMLVKSEFYVTLYISSIIMLSRFFNNSYTIRKPMSPILFYCSVLSGLCVSTTNGLRIPVMPGFNSPKLKKIDIIRQRRASTCDIPSTNGFVLPLMKTRRKSLPALGLQNRKVSMCSVDLSILGEAHGMITDLLADSSLPMNVNGTLRIVADMISPVLQNGFQRQPFATNLVTMFEKQQTEEDEQQVLNQPDLKDDTPLSLKQRLQRNLAVNSRRMSSTYTTTTSASGMPTIDMEYHSKKSSSNNYQHKKCYRSKSQANIFSSKERPRNANFCKSHSFSENESPATLRKFDKHTVEDIFKVEITRGRPVFFKGMEEQLDSSDDNSADSPKETLKANGTVINDKNNLKQKLSSLCASTEPLLETHCCVNDQPDAKTEHDVACSKVLPPLTQRNVNLNVAQVAPVCKSKDSSRMRKDSLTVPVNNASKRRNSKDLYLEYEVAENKEVNGLLNRIDTWDFPIFELSEKCNVLTQLAFRIFKLCGFFNTFQIPENTFMKYFRALESGYHDIPYHNRIHAADVLHGVYYLTQSKIPGFNASMTSDEDDYEAHDCMAQVMPELELMALYIAAAMHDFDHPGRTNAFLVATLNSKAVLYNDRSVLENHHAAAAWSLLITNPGMNFLEGLSAVDFKRFRFIVIEEILSTDLKKHFDFLTEWNAKISEHGLCYTSEADRLMVGQMAIKVADIAGPSKEWSLHYRWTERIVEEFYQQGEDEKMLGMPLSAYMDRNDSKVPQLQSSFIKHLVSPLCVAYDKAGIMPGVWREQDDEENSESESDDEAKKKKVIFSVPMENIRKNHEHWLNIIENETTDQDAVLKEEKDTDDSSEAKIE